MELQEFLGILKLTPPYESPARWGADTDAIVEAHFQYLMDLKAEGRLVLAGRTQYPPGHPDLAGIMVFRAQEVEEARMIVSKDPAVTGGLMTCSVHPYRTAISQMD